MFSELVRDKTTDAPKSDTLHQHEFSQRPSEVEVRRWVRRCLRDEISGNRQENLASFLYEGAFNAYSYALTGGSPRLEHRQNAGAHVFRVVDRGPGILQHYCTSAFGSQSSDRSRHPRELLLRILTTQMSSTPDPSAGWGTVDMLRAALELGSRHSPVGLSLNTGDLRLDWTSPHQEPSCQAIPNNGTTWEISVSAH